MLYCLYTKDNSSANECVCVHTHVYLHVLTHKHYPSSEGWFHNSRACKNKTKDKTLRAFKIQVSDLGEERTNKIHKLPLSQVRDEPKHSSPFIYPQQVRKANDPTTLELFLITAVDTFHSDRNLFLQD